MKGGIEKGPLKEKVLGVEAGEGVGKVDLSMKSFSFFFSFSHTRSWRYGAKFWGGEDLPGLGMSNSRKFSVGV